MIVEIFGLDVGTWGQWLGGAVGSGMTLAIGSLLQFRRDRVAQKREQIQASAWLGIVPSANHAGKTMACVRICAGSVPAQVRIDLRCTASGLGYLVVSDTPGLGGIKTVIEAYTERLFTIPIETVLEILQPREKNGRIFSTEELLDGLRFAIGVSGHGEVLVALSLEHKEELRKLLCAFTPNNLKGSNESSS